MQYSKQWGNNYGAKLINLVHKPTVQVLKNLNKLELKVIFTSNQECLIEDAIKFLKKDIDYCAKLLSLTWPPMPKQIYLKNVCCHQL